jgi:hypothetical protein
VAELQTVMTAWEQWWSDRTAHALTLCTSLGEGCAHPVQRLGAGTIDDDDGVLEPGQEVAFDVGVSAQDARVFGARVEFSLYGNGAEYTTLSDAEVNVGELAPDETRTAPEIDAARPLVSNRRASACVGGRRVRQPTDGIIFNLYTKVALQLPACGTHEGKETFFSGGCLRTLMKS